MGSEYEERVLSILRGGEGWDHEYSSVSEFKHGLNEGGDDGGVEHEKSNYGWVFWREKEREQKQQIITLLRNLASGYWFMSHYLVQFWGKAEGQNRNFLSASDYPFCVGPGLRKGLCSYRRLCAGHRVHVDDVEGGDEGVGRAYRNRQAESTPDLRLYSREEFPMRDEAARCGFRGYMALPVFDVRTDGYCGVMELLCRDPRMRTYLLSTLDEALQIAGLRATRNSISINDYTTKEFVGTEGILTILEFRFNELSSQYKQQPEPEITEILEQAMATVPRLYLAQVWVPCKQCDNTNTSTGAGTDLRCMEIASFISSKHKRINWWEDIDDDMHDYLQACEFYHLRIDISTSHSHLCDITISNNRLAHYARRARLSHCFAISLRSSDGRFYVIEFFLHPKCREAACSDYSLSMLLRIMERKVKSFEFVSGRNLLEESRRNPNSGVDISLDEMSLYEETFLEPSDFTSYLDVSVDTCCLRPPSENGGHGWVFYDTRGKKNSLQIKERVKDFMKNMAVKWWKMRRWIVQFWAPKMIGGKWFLETSNQPYAVGCLSKGLASFRKKCMGHYYFVDDEAREEDLGPPGRVFRRGYREITNDLFHYSNEEFPLRNYAMHSCSRGYSVLPIFHDELNYKCVGVMEFLGFFCYNFADIARELKAAKLGMSHLEFQPRFLANEQPFSTINCKREALTELNVALGLMCDNIPQLHMANVWVPYQECVTGTHGNMSCMELALCSNQLGKFMPKNQLHWLHNHPGKGIVGMVLASEDKSCFCRNMCEFSISDQPLSHQEMSDRCNICFAICLQSSHTGGLLHVLEFFLYQGPATYEYVRSFLKFLLPVMKHELPSFKIGSGKEMGEELVVEVIEFSDANRLEYSFEQAEEADAFPIKFKSVLYGQVEHLRIEEECSAVASCSNTRERGKRKTKLVLSLDVLKPHFGKKLKDVAEELGVGRSTIKRACRGYGIHRWPSKEEHDGNPVLLEGESETNFQQQMNTREDEEEAEKVIIKVKHGEDIIKFELRLSFGLAKLIEEVASRLNLEMGTFKLKYVDEDGDEILLTRDADLQLCRKSQILMGKNFIQMFVRR